jgi:uncharacterized membrane protein
MAMRKVHSGSRGKNRRNSSNRRHNNVNSRDAANSNNFNIHPSVLPAPSILQEYEYATEGAADRIIEMAEVEQDRRHEWEDSYLIHYKKSLRIGQLFGFLLLASVIFSSVFLAMNGHENVAVYLALIAFFSVALSNLFVSMSSKRNSRRPSRRKK